MGNQFFKTGKVTVGGSEVAFERRLIRGNFLMYVPESFSEDANIVSNYSYLFARDKSPLSIAIKFSQFTAPADGDKMIAQYFSGADGEAPVETQDGIYFRETVSGGRFLPVYSLRFCVRVEGGALFGCFNCDAAYKEDWRLVVVEMLRNIKPHQG